MLQRQRYTRERTVDRRAFGEADVLCACGGSDEWVRVYVGLYYADVMADLGHRQLRDPLATVSKSDGVAFVTHMQIGDGVNGSFLVRRAV